MREIKGVPPYVQRIVDQQRRDAENPGFSGGYDAEDLVRRLGLKKQKTFFEKITDWLYALREKGNINAKK